MSVASTVYPYVFAAEIEKFGVGKNRKIWYNVLFLPPDLKARLPFEKYSQLRIEGEIAEIPIANAFIPAGDGRHYVIVSPKVLKDGEVSVGDRVELRFAIADQDLVDAPEELTSALERRSSAQKAWESYTPGRKRMIAQHVLSAKTTPTRSRRVEEAIEAVLHFRGDINAWRRSRKS